MSETPTTVVLLHGFAATPRHWDRVVAALPAGRFAPTALDLADADPPTPAGVRALVEAIVPERFVLVGYSMGGRLALDFALAAPARIERLVLVSTSAGIEDATERAARRASDEALAASIEREPIEAFVARWQAVALFARDPDWVKEAVAVDERRCSPAVLAASLRAFGPGVMGPMWGRLHELEMPAAILAGAEDANYVRAGRRLADALPRSSLEVVPGVGHRLALEAPEAVVRAITGE